eukprot:4989508-Prymnesium_polylepis.1
MPRQECMVYGPALKCRESLNKPLPTRPWACGPPVRSPQGAGGAALATHDGPAHGTGPHARVD